MMGKRQLSILYDGGCGLCRREIAYYRRLGFILARQFLMPRINEYRDRQLAGDVRAGSRFKPLHASSVAVNLAQIVAAATVLLRLNAAP
jgi:hypothetical protein